jgi:hypothetical protein
MAELETNLRELGRHVEFPPAPDLAGPVRARLGRQGRDWRRPAAIALAVLAVAIGAALAVPSARTAILEWLTRVEHLPAVPAIGNLDLGQELPLAEAGRRASWLVVPSDAPDHAYLSSGIPGGKLTLLWGSPTKVRLLLTEFRGVAYLEKLVTPGTTLELVQVGTAPGAWIPDPHVVLYRDRNGQTREDTARLVGHTLLWQRGDVTLRLEGRVSREEALRIARSAR